MTVLGIDYGTKRIGLSLASDGESPRRLQVIVNDQQLFEHLRQVIAEHSVSMVAVGLPRNLDGEDTQQTGLARAFAQRLVDEFEIRVVLQDEADTSNLARQRLTHQKLSDQERERQVDAEAAVIILEDYIRDSGGQS